MWQRCEYPTEHGHQQIGDERAEEKPADGEEHGHFHQQALEEAVGLVHVTGDVQGTDEDGEGTSAGVEQQDDGKHARVVPRGDGLVDDVAHGVGVRHDVAKHLAGLLAGPVGVGEPRGHGDARHTSGKIDSTP